jgi:hypothetical protein
MFVGRTDSDSDSSMLLRNPNRQEKKLNMTIKKLLDCSVEIEKILLLLLLRRNPTVSQSLNAKFWSTVRNDAFCHKRRCHFYLNKDKGFHTDHVTHFWASYSVLLCTGGWSIDLTSALLTELLEMQAAQNTRDKHHLHITSYGAPPGTYAPPQQTNIHADFSLNGRNRKWNYLVRGVGVS